MSPREWPPRHRRPRRRFDRELVVSLVLTLGGGLALFWFVGLLLGWW